MLGKYRAVQVGDMFNQDYQIHKVKYIFFREPCDDRKELEQLYLEDNYADSLYDWYSYQIASESEYAEEDSIARKIYDAELLSQGIGSKFELQYSAKGVPYYDLGNNEYREATGE